MGDSLKGKAIIGVGWSTMENVARYGITFVVTLVLARLLGPDEYGLIGIVSILINVFNAIVDSGLTAALVRKKNVNNTDYSTVFVANFVISVFLSIVLFFLSGYISVFFSRPELKVLTEVMSVVIVINSLAIVQKARLTREINFRIQTKISVIATILSGILGIALAYMGYGVWALVWQQISSQLLITILLWYFNRWRPQLIFSIESFKELWGFGWKLLASSLIGTIWDEVFSIVIGKCYSPSSLGLYTRARQFASLCSSNINTVVQRVSYPVLSSIQDDKERLKNGYERVIKMTMLPTFVLMVGMAAVAKPMIVVLIGEKWIGCIPMLQLICFDMMLYPLHALNLNAIQVLGRSDLILKLRIIKTIIATSVLIVGIVHGILWMLFASIIIGWLSYFLNSYFLKSLLDYTIYDQLRTIIPGLVIALVMGGIVFTITFLSINVYVMLISQMILGLIVVIFLCEKIQLAEYIELKSILMSVSKK